MDGWLVWGVSFSGSSLNHPKELISVNSFSYSPFSGKYQSWVFNNCMGSDFSSLREYLRKVYGLTIHPCQRDSSISSAPHVFISLAEPPESNVSEMGKLTVHPPRKGTPNTNILQSLSRPLLLSFVAINNPTGSWFRNRITFSFIPSKSSISQLHQRS